MLDTKIIFFIPKRSGVNYMQIPIADLVGISLTFEMRGLSLVSSPVLDRNQTPEF